MPLDSWFTANLACPVDHTSLTADSAELVCANGHRYPVVDGVPVMLRPDVPSTIVLADASLQRARGAGIDQRAPELYLESLGISEDEKRGVLDLAAAGSAIDPVVAYLIAATNGLMYRHLIGSLSAYPIPDLALPPGSGRRLVDVGCSWGRWSIAASRLGYEVLGVDPSLGAVMAARRVARQLNLPNRYVVADARYLPLPADAVDVTYSYSVLQHFSFDDATMAIGEMGRVLKPRGIARVQMPTRFGIRCLYHQARRSFRDATGFEVRYWTLAALASTFSRHIGPVRFEVDGYFGIGLQRADEPLMTPSLRRVLHASEFLKAISRRFRPLIGIADSVFVEATARA
ncbi:MAG TPA: methyltransferase domain-containing protein [Vicinamibacterales bacterium]|nr:methyltransferase domain-containing protein [Vicinamibacterales bacterium]